MSLFKRDPMAALVKAEADKAAAEARLIELQGRRSAALEEDGLTPAARVDHDIAQTRDTVLILDDKIAAIRVEIAKQREAQRELDKKAAIEALEERLTAKNRAAVELERAVAEFGKAYIAFEAAAADVWAVWPEDLLGDPHAYHVRDAVAVQIVNALGMQPGACDVRLREVAERAGPIAEQVVAASAAILEALRGSPLPRVLEMEAA